MTDAAVPSPPPKKKRKNTSILKTAAAARYIGVGASALLGWVNHGLLPCTTTPGGHRRFHVTALDASVANRRTESPPSNPAAPPPSQPETQAKRRGAIYARVSSSKQKDDLARQIQALQTRYPDYKVYQDVCSGLKYTRRGLERLLVAAQEGLVTEVVVSHKDRLARFGTELYEWIFRRAGVNVVVLDDHVLSHEQEVPQDLLAVVHVFSRRLNGKRKYTQNGPGGKRKKKPRVQGVLPLQRSQSPPESEAGQSSGAQSGPLLAAGAPPHAAAALLLLAVVPGQPEDLQFGHGAGVVGQVAHQPESEKVNVCSNSF